MAPRNSTLPLDDPEPELIKPQLALVGGTKDEQEEDHSDGHIAIQIEHEDGSVTIDFDPPDEEGDSDDLDFDENLALHMEPEELEKIASRLIEGIDRDETSRKEWLETRALGISLLGLKIEKPRSDAGSTSAPLEGMSTVRHPLLLESTVTFQATARAELLPSSGPVKVRNDSTVPPRNVTQETSAAQQLADSLNTKDELAQALEKDMNHYLTAIATEYVPDTDRMLFYVGFGGDGFKKVYNCPLRRRTVSESVDAADLIVSNAATDLQNAGRVTHVIKMRQSVLRRMQILGVYRDIDLSPPAPPKPNVVQKKEEEVFGISTAQKRPEDEDYTVYETYCELDLDQFAPEQFKDKGLPLPYRVTLEKDSRKILDIRRNWEEDDDECLAKRFFVQFPFIRGLGFYGLGFIHLLGNTTNALTAAWREMLDAGMFASFPGFLYVKGAGRQLSNQFRIPPGGGVGLDIGSQTDIRQAIMPLPYRDVGAGFNAFVDKIEQSGRRLGAAGSPQVGEGKQDAPVGTTIALIEMASKVIDSAHKRLHAAQAEEFKLIKCRLREDPEAFWRHNKKPTIEWKKEQLIDALNSCELVPVADPNNPTSLHRLAKAMAIKELQKANPAIYDPIAVDMRVFRIANIDPEGLFRPTPAPPPPDPRMEAIKSKADMQSKTNEIQLLETKIKAATQAAAINDRAQDRASREKIAEMKIELERLKIEEEKIIHQNEDYREAEKTMHELQLNSAVKTHEATLDAASRNQELMHGHAEKLQELHHDNIAREHEHRGDQLSHQRDQAREDEKHRRQMDRDNEAHEIKKRHDEEMHQAKLAAARALAKVKKPSKPK